MKTKDMSVEESPLLIEYATLHGGRSKKAEAKHVQNNFEAVMVAHRVPPMPGAECTINQRVTMTDPYGNNKGKLPALQGMSGLQLPNGAPNGGARCAFPPQMLRVLVNRCEPPEIRCGVGTCSYGAPV